jgi:multiple sugar transport system permease protein
MTTTTRGRAPRSRRSRFRVAAGIGTWIYAVTLALPIYYLVISAFKSNTEMFTVPLVPTFSQGFAQFASVWYRLDVGSAMLNSAYVTAVSLVLTLVLAVPAAYALARSRGWVAQLVERVYALGFLIPAFAALVPTLLLSILVNLYHTREFMILYLPASAQPLAVILLTQFMRTVPAELEESASIDGASRFQILRVVYLPLVWGGIATVTILNFIGFWNEYLFALILIGPDVELRTLPVAIPTLAASYGVTDNALIAAGTVFSILPVFVVYAILNRRMENALIQGAVKG